MKRGRRTALSLLLPFLISAYSPASSASEGEKFPDRPVKLVLPFAPGGVTDLVARTVATELSKEWGQPVIVDNRAGASGMIGNEYVAKSLPDGYTILIGISQVTSAPALYKKIPYDIERDFIPLTRIVGSQIAFVTADPEIKTLADFIRQAKSSPGKYAYGTVGTGIATHILGEVLKLQTGIQIANVPYKGGAAMVNDLLGGNLPVAISDITTPLPFLQTGKLRAFAINGPQRNPLFASVPTLEELGYKGFDRIGWIGAWVPAKTPGVVVEKIRDSFIRSVQTPAIRGKFIQLGLIPVDNPTDMATRIKEDIAYWKRTVDATGVKVEE